MKPTKRLWCYKGVMRNARELYESGLRKRNPMPFITFRQRLYAHGNVYKAMKDPVRVTSRTPKPDV